MSRKSANWMKMTTPLDSSARRDSREVLCREHSLHHQLVRAMRCHGEKCSAQNARPEGVGGGEVHGEVEHVELARRRAHRVDRRPAAGDVRAQRPDGDQRSANVDRHLHHVGPDDGGHSALEGVEQRERGDDGDREHVSRANGDAHHDGDSEDAHALGGGAGEQKEPRGDLVQRVAEAAVDQLIGGEHLALEVFGQEEQRPPRRARACIR